MDNTIRLLAQQLGAHLSAAGDTVSVAESCTGGGIGHAITMVPGSSAWFEMGFITYSNRAKSRLLGVSEALLESHGAVSEAVAEAMAGGAAGESGARYAVSVSGVAGPDGGTALKPVGMVCFGFCANGALTSETHHFPGDRDAVRRASVRMALEGLIRRIPG